MTKLSLLTGSDDFDADELSHDELDAVNGGRGISSNRSATTRAGTAPGAGITGVRHRVDAVGRRHPRQSGQAYGVLQGTVDTVTTGIDYAHGTASLAQVGLAALGTAVAAIPGGALVGDLGKGAEFGAAQLTGAVAVGVQQIGNAAFEPSHDATAPTDTHGTDPHDPTQNGANPDGDPNFGANQGTHGEQQEDNTYGDHGGDPHDGQDAHDTSHDPTDAHDGQDAHDPHDPTDNGQNPDGDPNYGANQGTHGEQQEDNTYGDFGPADHGGDQGGAVDQGGGDHGGGGDVSGDASGGDHSGGGDYSGGGGDYGGGDHSGGGDYSGGGGDASGGDHSGGGGDYSSGDHSGDQGADQGGGGGGGDDFGGGGGDE